MDGRLLKEAQAVVDRLLSLLLGEGFVGISHAESQTQTQGIGKLHPALYIAAEDKVEVGEKLGRSRCLMIGSEHVDGVVELGKEGFVHILLAVISHIDTATEAGVGQRAIHVCQTAHAEYLDHIAQSCHGSRTVLVRVGLQREPGLHQIGIGVVEGQVYPLVGQQIMGIVQRAHIVRSLDIGEIAREEAAGEHILYLESATLVQTYDEYVVLHLGEEGTGIHIVVGHIFFSSRVVVGVPLVKLRRT